jgi:predicted kinase
MSKGFELRQRSSINQSSGLPPRTLFVVVSGPPASGKSTLALAIAEELDLPLLAKDTIKEALMSVLPVPDVEASRGLGRAAMTVMWAVAAQSGYGAVLESNFHRTFAATEIQRLPGDAVEVFCRCDPSVAALRYEKRASARHAGHFDSTRTSDELWSDEVTEPVAGGWPVLEVATDRAVDIGEVIRLIRCTRVATELA